MNLPGDKTSRGGLTLIEVLVIIAILCVLATLLLPMFPIKKGNRRVACMNHLKQIGILEIVWAEDHNQKPAASLSTNQDGTREYLLAGRLDRHFQAFKPNYPIVNIFTCPADKRQPAVEYDSLKNENISYFTSLDRNLTNVALITGGDRNLTLNGMQRPGLMVLTATSATGWTKEIHNQKASTRLGGNFNFADGHCEFVSESNLTSRLAQLGTNANHLVFP